MHYAVDSWGRARAAGLRVVLGFAAIAIFGISGQATASMIVEVEGNNSISGAQNIDAYFSLDYDVNIGNVSGANTSTTIPHVTILSLEGNYTYDYYSFAASAGSIGIFDIDFGGKLDPYSSIDTEIGLYTSTGVLLANNDDGTPAEGAGGSASSVDSFIQYTFASAGTYVIAVGRYNTSFGTGSNTPLSGNTPGIGQTYTLQVSSEGHSVVPEPSTAVLMAWDWLVWRRVVGPYAPSERSWRAPPGTRSLRNRYAFPATRGSLDLPRNRGNPGDTRFYRGGSPGATVARLF